MQTHRPSKTPGTCKTPGAIYHFNIDPDGWAIELAVDLPFKPDLTADEAIELDERIHKALEAALAPLWGNSEDTR